MNHPIEHPPDEVLLRAIDGELTSDRRRALDEHLAQCERCRARVVGFEETSAETVRVCRSVSVKREATDALRARLEARMTEISTEWERSPWFRMRERFVSAPAFVGLVACVILVVGLTRLTPVDPRDDHDSSVNLPIRALTPGATAALDAATLCAGQLPARRPIPVSVRQAILREYRMQDLSEDEYELDYLITPELGGIGERKNLWPQRYVSGVWNAGVKDDLERLLPRLVCQGTVDLVSAQHAIAQNWITAYQKYFKTDRPLVRHAARERDDDDAQQLFSDARLVRASWRTAQFIYPGN